MTKKAKNMIKEAKTRLRNVVRTCRGDLIATGRYATPDLHKLIDRKFRAEVLACADQMARGSINQIHSELIRQDCAFSKVKGTQLVLPLKLRSIKIPASIHISYRSDEGVDELLWVSFEEASFQEFESYIGMLRAQIAADTRRLRDMEKIYEVIVSTVDDEADTMGAIFKHLFGKDADAA